LENVTRAFRAEGRTLRDVEHDAELAMVRRHVASGEGIVARQQELVERLRRAGHDTEPAETILEQFRSILAEHERHLDRLVGASRR
jgi:predicted HicB family RNase H-like nuclease